MAEGHALLRPFQCRLESALRDAGGLRSDADAAAIERGERDLVAFAFVADAVFFGDFAIGENQLAAGGGVDAEFFFFFADLETRCALFHDDRGDSLLAFGRIGVDVDDGRVGHAAIGDPRLGAVQNIFAAAFHRFGLQGGGVRARLRLGQGVAADFFSTGKGQQKSLFLRLGAEAVDGIAEQRILHAEDHAGGSAAARNLFDNDGVGDMVEARAAFGFGKGDSGEAEFGGFAEEFAGEMAGFVIFLGEGANFRFGKFADGFLEKLLVFGEFEIQAISPCRSKRTFEYKILTRLASRVTWVKKKERTASLLRRAKGGPYTGHYTGAARAFFRRA